MNKIILTAIVLLSYFSIIAQTKFTQPISIPFKLTPSGHILIEAAVNGVKGTFIFDTGAGTNLLTKKFADKITDLQKTNHFYTGHRATGEQLQVDLYNAKELAIGEYKLPQEIFAVYDIVFPIDGLISLTPFKNHPITIDFEHKVLQIETPKSLNQLAKEKDFEMPIQISNDRDIKIGISTMIKLNDQLELAVGLDSGAGFNVFRFNSRYMSELGIDKNTAESKYIASPFKPELGNQYYFTKLAKMTDFQNQTSVIDFKATFIDGLIHEGIMGINWIGNKITIDLSAKKLIIKK